MAFAKKTETVVKVVAPKRETIAVLIRGTADMVMHRMAQKAVNMMKEKMEEGQAARTKKVRAARDFDEDYEECFHRSEEGWIGIPCTAFKAGMVDIAVDAQAVGAKVKRHVWVEPDGIDPRSRTPLVKITKGEPSPFMAYAMNGKFGMIMVPAA